MSHALQPNRHARHLVLLTVLVAATLPFGALRSAAQGAPQGPPPVVVAKPVVKDIIEYDEFTGRFEASESVEIRSRVTGYLESVEFTDGAVVKAGDLLFTIDPRPYQAAFDRAKSAVEQAQSRLEFAQGDLARAENLRTSGNISDQLLDQRRQSSLGAQAELAGAKAALEASRLDLEFTRIRSPIAGRASRHLVSAGNLVRVNDTLLTTIVAVDPIKFYFDVDERSYLAYARTAANSLRAGGGGENRVTVATSDEPVPNRVGRLDFVENRLDEATGTVRTRATLANPDLYLKPGMFGRIRIAGSERYRGILVPDEAIASDQDRRVVYVVADDGSVMPRPIRPGPREDGYRVVREGLKGDETIVINGLMRIRPGVKVSPQLVTLPPVRSRPTN